MGESPGDYVRQIGEAYRSHRTGFVELTLDEGNSDAAAEGGE